MARAISSLPVPVSPRIRTGAVVGATFSTSSSVRCNGGLAPMISLNWETERTSARSETFSASRRLRSSSISAFCVSIRRT